MIDKAQEVFFLEERRSTSTKYMIGVKGPLNTEAIDVYNDGQSSAGRYIMKKTRKPHFGAGLSNEDILMCQWKGETVFVEVQNQGIHADEQLLFQMKAIEEEERRCDGYEDDDRIEGR